MNKVEPMQASELLQPNQLAEMDTWFLTPGYQARTNRYTLVFEVDEATWLQFKTSVPKGSLVHQRFFFNDGEASDESEAAESEMEEKPPAKPKREPKTKQGTDENGRYWQRMEYPGSYYAVPGVAEVLGCQPIESEVNKAMREAFKVQTRRQISPDDLETWAAINGLENLITVSRTAHNVAERKHNARQTET